MGFANRLRAEFLDEKDETLRGYKRSMLEASRRGERKKEFFAHSEQELKKLLDFLNREGIKFTEKRKKGSDWSMEHGSISWDCVNVTASW